MRDVMSAVGALRRFGPAGAASVAANEIMKARPTAAGTLTEARKRGDYKPSQNMPNPQEGMTRAQSFDAAFADARKAGKKQFDWRGRTYTTQMK